MKKHIPAIVTSCVLLTAAAILRFAMIGYGFLALVLSAVAVAVLLLSILPKSLKFVLLSCIIAFCCVFAGFEGAVIRESKGRNYENADYIIVLGAAVHGNVPSMSLGDRLNAATEYLKTYIDCTAILSGGQGEGENISEAAAMKKVLMARGIEESRLIIEDKSTSTIENLSFSVEKIVDNARKRLNHILPQELAAESRPLRIVICSSEYHLCRARYVGRKVLNMDFGTYPAHTSLQGIKLTNFLREAAGMIAMKYYELTGRL